jgi:hypothetical protein
VQRLQQRQHRHAEQTIQKCGKSQLFHAILNFAILRIAASFDPRATSNLLLTSGF